MGKGRSGRGAPVTKQQAVVAAAAAAAGLVGEDATLRTRQEACFNASTSLRRP
jgi:hypothetical protein